MRQTWEARAAGYNPVSNYSATDFQWLKDLQQHLEAKDKRSYTFMHPAWGLMLVQELLDGLCDNKLPRWVCCSSQSQVCANVFFSTPSTRVSQTWLRGWRSS